MKKTAYSVRFTIMRSVQQDIEDDRRRLHSFGLTSPQEGAGDFSDVGFSLGGLLSSMFEPAARAMDAPGQAAYSCGRYDWRGVCTGGAMVGGTCSSARSCVAVK